MTYPVRVSNQIQDHLGHIRWLNFWSSKDPISGPLSFYNIPPVDGHRLDLPGWWMGAHVTYWGHDLMYETIIKELFP